MKSMNADIMRESNHSQSRIRQDLAFFLRNDNVRKTKFEPSYHGPFLIIETLDHPNFGKTFKLQNVQTGQIVKHLVHPNRLRKANLNTDLFDHRFPISHSEMEPESILGAKQPPPTNQPEMEFEEALGILKQRIKRGKKEFLVLFHDRTKFWCTYDNVSPALLQNWRLKLAERRRKHRRRRKN